MDGDAQMKMNFFALLALLMMHFIATAWNKPTLAEAPSSMPTPARIPSSH